MKDNENGLTKKVEEKHFLIDSSIKNSIIPIGIKMLFCMMVYSVMLTQNLVNSHDATWTGSFYRGGEWELSIGRFMIYLIDTINFGRHIQPFNFLIMLLICTISTEIIAYIFDCSGNDLINYVFSFLFLSNTVITCWLSYSYITNMYSLGFFFSALTSLYIARISRGGTGNIR